MTGVAAATGRQGGGGGVEAGVELTGGEARMAVVEAKPRWPWWR